MKNKKALILLLVLLVVLIGAYFGTKIISEKFGDELDDVDIENELVKIAFEENLYDLDNHIENLATFFREVFVENDYKLFSQEEYLHEVSVLQLQ